MIRFSSGARQIAPNKRRDKTMYIGALNYYLAADTKKDLYIYTVIKRPNDSVVESNRKKIL